MLKTKTYQGYIDSDLVTEVCPHCDREATIEWSIKKDGYKAHCPYCGKKLMLCSECTLLDKGCDWNSETDSCNQGANYNEVK
jgi:DNA-directed RNA polymerase subunit RPC12/RpoP